MGFCFYSIVMWCQIERQGYIRFDSQYTFRKRRNKVTRQKERERYLIQGVRLDKVGTDLFT